MYRKNTKHEQQDLFDYSDFGFQNVLKRIEKKEEYYFYKTIFCKINEDIFAPLYCDNNGRPNSPINSMVSALILKEKKNWSFAELFREIEFNLLTRAALGLFSIDEMPFNYPTIFNFIKRTKLYEEQHGLNLFQQVFDELTLDQLKKLKLKTTIARTDSFMVDSNIRSYGRLELLIEVILRLYRILSNEDQRIFLEKFTPYVDEGSIHYIYNIKGSDLSHEYVKITETYYWLKTYISESYSSNKEYETFIRVYNEHFNISDDDKPKLIDSKELSSSCLRSPDDPDATLRVKREEVYSGQVTSITETANPENDLNIIIDIANSPNNVDDSRILNERLPIIGEKLPDLNELHMDGGYGSEANDKLMFEMGISPIQTAVKGIKSEVPMRLISIGNNKIRVSCPGDQSVIASRKKNWYKAEFNLKLCESCEFKEKCKTKKLAHYRTYYFRELNLLRQLRHYNIFNLPLERQTIRANVEASVKEFRHRMNNHKLKVRGAFKSSLFIFTTAIAINFGRIFRYCLEKGKNMAEYFIFVIFKLYISDFECYPLSI